MGKLSQTQRRQDRAGRWPATSSVSVFVALAAAMLAVAGAPAAAAVTPTTAHRPKSPGGTLVIQGAGFGHGVGMSQEGALGLAEHGYSYQAILAHYYSGTALSPTNPKQTVKVLDGTKVLTMGLERYVRGVVGAEVSASWPMAALEAQAVASRTYVLTSHAGGSAFNVYSDTRSQMYLGKAAESPQTNAAVAATRGQIVTYNGQPAITYFFASSGGLTENVSNAFPGAEPQPWLRGVADPYDQGPLHRWKITIGMAHAQRLLAGLVRGSLVGIEVLKRGWSPRIVSAEVLGSGGATEVSGPELEDRLSLPSTWAYFSIHDRDGTRAEPDASHYKLPAGTGTLGVLANGTAPAANAPASASPSAPTPAPVGGAQPAPANTSSVTAGPGGGTTSG